MQKLKTSELKLGDVVSVFEHKEGFDTATVINIVNGEVVLFRPYVHISDYSHTGGVTPYLGFEEFRVSQSERIVTVYSRTEVK